MIEWLSRTVVSIGVYSIKYSVLILKVRRSMAPNSKSRYWK